MDVEAWIPRLYRAWKALSGNPRTVRDYPTADELAALGQGVRRLSRGFTGHRNLVGARYLDDPILLGAYLLYYWPLSYLQTRTALVGIDWPTKPNVDLLDLGCGPGPVALALFDEAKNRGQTLQITGLDHSAKALELFRQLGQAESAKISIIQASVGAGLPKPPKKPWDIISLGHVLNELSDSAKGFASQSRLLDQASRAIGDTGLVLVLEPALRSTADQLLAHRDRLVAAGHPILGPCSFTSACPARAASQTCHSEVLQALPKTVQALASLAGLEKTAVAMAYLIFGSPKAPSRQPVTWQRVVSEPMQNKAARTRLMICGPQGRLSFSAKLGGNQVPANQAAFARLRRGQAIQILDPEIRDGGWGLAETTRILPQS